MLLEAAAAISALGVIGFLAGAKLKRPELVIVGAIIVIAVGGAAQVDGLQVKSGVESTTEILSERVAAPSISNGTHVHTKDVSSEDTAPSGLTFNENGQSFMYVVGQQNDRVYQYDAANFDLSLATFNRSQLLDDSLPTGIEIRPTGNRMFITGDDNNSVLQYDLSEPNNVSTGTLSGELAVNTDPRGIEFSNAGDKLYIVDADGLINSFELTEAWNISTATALNSFDVSSQDSTPAGLGFDNDGTRLVVVGEVTQTVYEYDLSTAFDLTTASYNNEFLSVSAEVNSPSAVTFEVQAEKLFVADEQGNTIEQYDVSTIATVESKNETIVYRDIQTQSEFPLGVVVLLLGVLMLFYGAGEASEQ